jgi:hypothetical protein
MRTPRPVVVHRDRCGTVWIASDGEHTGRGRTAWGAARDLLQYFTEVVDLNELDIVIEYGYPDRVAGLRATGRL